MNELRDTIDVSKKVVDSSAETVKKSADDWLSYVQQHPIQSFFFGAAIYLAIKELLAGTLK